MANAVTHRGAYHADRQIYGSKRGRFGLTVWRREESLQQRLCLAESTQPQAQAYQGQQRRRAQEKTARSALQRTKPAKLFPHLLAGFGAVHCRRAAPAVP